MVFILSKRYIAVTFDGKTVEAQHITFEIPQGYPVLSFLFCTYLKPLLDTIKADCLHISYVDDIRLLFSVPERKSLYTISN